MPAFPSAWKISYSFCWIFFTFCTADSIKDLRVFTDWSINTCCTLLCLSRTFKTTRLFGLLHSVSFLLSYLDSLLMPCFTIELVSISLRLNSATSADANTF
jgi:hypothetical protein